MKVTVDQDACTGSGQCVLIAPEVFDQRDTDGIVVLLSDSPDPLRHEDVREAARICPALAITLTQS
ncbi:ferredoxin [Streptosporangium sp. KLBMP 9127]|nr:ferredoxin [Streptosporangium sp. KLBMP 9127]